MTGFALAGADALEFRGRVAFAVENANSGGSGNASAASAASLSAGTGVGVGVGIGFLRFVGAGERLPAGAGGGDAVASAAAGLDALVVLTMRPEHLAPEHVDGGADAALAAFRALVPPRRVVLVTHRAGAAQRRIELAGAPGSVRVICVAPQCDAEEAGAAGRLPTFVPTRLLLPPRPMVGEGEGSGGGSAGAGAEDPAPRVLLMQGTLVAERRDLEGLSSALRSPALSALLTSGAARVRIVGSGGPPQHLSDAALNSGLPAGSATFELDQDEAAFHAAARAAHFLLALAPRGATAPYFAPALGGDRLTTSAALALSYALPIVARWELAAAYNWPPEGVVAFVDENGLGGSSDPAVVASLWPAFREAREQAQAAGGGAEAAPPRAPEATLEAAMVRAASMAGPEYTRARAAVADLARRFEARAAAAWSDVLGFAVAAPPPPAALALGAAPPPPSSLLPLPLPLALEPRAMADAALPSSSSAAAVAGAAAPSTVAGAAAPATASAPLSPSFAPSPAASHLASPLSPPPLPLPPPSTTTTTPLSTLPLPLSPPPPPVTAQASAPARRRIAVILTGHFRAFDRTAPYWRRAVEGLDADFFIYTWSLRDSSTVTWNRPQRAPPAPPLGAAELALLREFDPRARVGVQEWAPEDEAPANIRGPAPVKALLYAYEGVAACARDVAAARAAGAAYDAVVLSRPDILVRVPLAARAAPARGEVVFGARPDKRMLQGVASVDLLRIVHPDDLPLIPEGVPRELEAWRRDAARFTFGEEPSTAVHYAAFTTQTVAWEWGQCTFYVLRKEVLACAEAGAA